MSEYFKRDVPVSELSPNMAATVGFRNILLAFEDGKLTKEQVESEVGALWVAYLKAVGK